MKIIIAGHITKDLIKFNDILISSIGGSPCYSGLTANTFGINVNIATKVGLDLEQENINWLLTKNISFLKSFKSTKLPTTNFHIVNNSSLRHLFLLNKCESLSSTQLENTSGDGIILSPVVDEIPLSLVKLSRTLFPHVFLDPQGFLRSFDKSGKCLLNYNFNTDIFQYIDSIKIGEEELPFITGTNNIDLSLTKLLKYNLSNIILTSSSGKVLLITPKHKYSINIPKIKILENTGIGDIFTGAFNSSLIKTGDPLWSVSVAISASQTSFGKFGIAKIPEYNTVIKNAYNIMQLVKKNYNN